MGKNGTADLTGHPWFAGFDWAKFRRQELVPPYKPKARPNQPLQRQLLLHAHQLSTASADVPARAQPKLHWSCLCQLASACSDFCPATHSSLHPTLTALHAC